MRSGSVLDFERGRHAAVVGSLESPLGLDRAVGGLGGVLPARPEALDCLVDVPEGLAEQRSHLGDSPVRWTGHGLRLVHEVAGVVEDPVDAARKGEQVLGLERGDERSAEGRSAAHAWPRRRAARWRALSLPRSRHRRPRPRTRRGRRSLAQPGDAGARARLRVGSQSVSSLNSSMELWVEPRASAVSSAAVSETEKNSVGRPASHSRLALTHLSIARW